MLVTITNDNVSRVVWPAMLRAGFTIHEHIGRPAGPEWSDTGQLSRVLGDPCYCQSGGGRVFFQSAGSLCSATGELDKHSGMGMRAPVCLWFRGAGVG